MKNISDVLQRMQLVHSFSTTDRESLTHTFFSLSQSEQQKYQQLLEMDTPIEQLQVMLKNRAKQPDRPAAVIQTLTPESNQYLGMSLEALSNKIRQQAAEECALDDSQQDALAVLAKPRRVRQKSTNEKRPAAPRNRSPEFKIPEWFKKTPPLIQKLVNDSIKELPVAFWDQLHARRKVKNMRTGIQSDRGKATHAIVTCLLATMNLSTLQCRTWGEDIAKRCDLTPSQVSRVLADLAETGLITKKATHDAKGHFLPLQISITKTLLEILGIGSKRLARVQQQHQTYSKPANQKIITMVKVVSSVSKVVASTKMQSLANFKQALRPLTASLTELKSSYTTTMVRLVEETLKTFGLGRYSSSFSTV